MTAMLRHPLIAILCIAEPGSVGVLLTPVSGNTLVCAAVLEPAP